MSSGVNHGKGTASLFSEIIMDFVRALNEATSENGLNTRVSDISPALDATCLEYPV
jgi:hypothetical protein